MTVRLDRDRYPVAGDTATARLEAPFDGIALVTVLTDRVEQVHTVEVRDGTATLTLPVEDWTAGAYVAATVFRPAPAEAEHGPGRAVGTRLAGGRPSGTAPVGRVRGTRHRGSLRRTGAGRLSGDERCRRPHPGPPHRRGGGRGHPADDRLQPTRPGRQGVRQATPGSGPARSVRPTDRCPARTSRNRAIGGRRCGRPAWRHPGPPPRPSLSSRPDAHRRRGPGRSRARHPRGVQRPAAPDGGGPYAGSRRQRTATRWSFATP